MTRLKPSSAFSLAIVATFMVDWAGAVTIETVPISNPGNAPDTEVASDGTTGYGSVGYNYRIGKYEITAGQYTEFLNAVARDDPNGLYSSSMSDPADVYGANIQRSGGPADYAYSVALDWANRPVNYVSFWDAARFANWLHNGQPNGPQGLGTTEDGAYINVGNQILFARQPGARFFIPTEDEWYKAAYHNKNAGLAASYFDYPTGSDAVPGTNATEGTNPGNNANYRIDFGVFAIGPPYYRTEVGEYELSDSAYGTFDQGGNVWEWNETVAINSTWRGMLGGGWEAYGFESLRARDRNAYTPTADRHDAGFRVASILETPDADFDHDGDVDGADFLNWQRGESPDPISAGDLAVWQAQFGTSSPSASVPESSTGLLGLLAAVGIFWKRKRAQPTPFDRGIA